MYTVLLRVTVKIRDRAIRLVLLCVTMLHMKFRSCVFKSSARSTVMCDRNATLDAAGRLEYSTVLSALWTESALRVGTVMSKQIEHDFYELNGER